MINRKTVGIIIAGMGIIMSMMSLGIFCLYALWPLPKIIRIFTSSFHNLFSIFPAIMIPITGIVMLILGLFSIFFGLSSLQSFSYPFNFSPMSIYLFLIFMSGLIYITNSIFLFSLKRLTPNYSVGLFYS